MKHKLTSKNATIKTLREFKKNATNKAEKIQELENKVDTLQAEFRHDIKEIYKDNQQELVKTLQGSIAINNQNKELRRG